MIKQGSSELKEPEIISPDSDIIFERRDHAKRISANFSDTIGPALIRAKKEFRISAHEILQETSPIEKLVIADIFRHKSVQFVEPEFPLTSTNSVRLPSESGKSSQLMVKFTERLNRLFLMSRVNMAREQEIQVTDKQLAIDSIINDRSLTPTMQRKKVEVLQQQFLDSDQQRKREKEATYRRELDDALRGKR